MLNKKIEAPFIPGNDENYDKKYCETPDKISLKTIERYNKYKQRDDYNIIFKALFVFLYIIKFTKKIINIFAYFIQ